MSLSDFDLEVLVLLKKRREESRRGDYDMSNFGPEVKALLENKIRESLREQTARYQRANVPPNTKAVIDQVFGQAKEQLLELWNKCEDAEIDALADFIDGVISDYLPDLQEQFNNRYS